MAYLAVRQGRENSCGYVFVDVDEDIATRFALVIWSLTPKGYARGQVDKRYTILHRLIVNAPSGSHVHHHDGDTLNCRRENLELLESEFEHRQAHKPRGVYWNRTKKRWCAQIWHSGKNHWLGQFTDEGSARATYEAAILRRPRTKP